MTAGLGVLASCRGAGPTRGQSAPVLIGLFTDASSVRAPANSERVRTIGFGRPGMGAASYQFDGAVDARLAAQFPLAAFIAADGRGFRLVEPVLTPLMFGATGKGDDDTVVLKSMIAYAARYGIDQLEFPAKTVFGISEPIEIPPSVRIVGGTGVVKVLPSETRPTLVAVGRVAGQPINPTRMVFRDFTFDANGQRAIGPYVQNGQQCTVQNVTVENLDASGSVGILIKSFKSGGQPGRGNRVLNCRVSGDPEGRAHDTTGIAIEAEIDFEGSGDQRGYWLKHFRAKAPDLPEMDAQIVNCEVTGGYYGASIAGAQAWRIDGLSCKSNTRSLSVQNASSGGVADGLRLVDSISSAILVAYGSSNNRFNGPVAETTRANGEALMQAVIGAKGNVFSNAVTHNSGGAPQHHYYCAVESDNCEFNGVTADGTALDAYIGVESAWSSGARDPASKARPSSGFGDALDHFAHRGMSGVKIRNASIHGGGRVPAFYFGQISDALGEHSLTGLVLEGAHLSGAFTAAVHTYSMTPARLSFASVRDNDAPIESAGLGRLVASYGE